MLTLGDSAVGGQEHWRGKGDLLGREKHLVNAADIAYRIKQSVRHVGSTLRCSIDVAPNRLLTKVTADIQKPDGLMVLEKRFLPEALYCLKLSDIPRIGTKTELRLRSAGIDSIRSLCAHNREQLASLWGSVWGERMWLWLRGEDFLEPAPEKLQTISRQHVLPPELRTRDKARDTALKMLRAAARRMLKLGLWAGGVSVSIGYLGIPQSPLIQRRLRLSPRIVCLRPFIDDGIVPFRDQPRPSAMHKCLRQYVSAWWHLEPIGCRIPVRRNNLRNHYDTRRDLSHGEGFRFMKISIFEHTLMHVVMSLKHLRLSTPPHANYIDPLHVFRHVATEGLHIVMIPSCLH